MVSIEQIQDYADKVACTFKPERIILFGSYAYGTPTPDSDVDLLVIMRFRGKNVMKAVDIQMRVHPPFPLDMLVRTPAKVDQRFDMGDGFIKEVLTRGQVLYEAVDRRVGGKGRGRRRSGLVSGKKQKGKS